MNKIIGKIGLKLIKRPFLFLGILLAILLIKGTLFADTANSPKILKLDYWAFGWNLRIAWKTDVPVTHVLHYKLQQQTTWQENNYSDFQTSYEDGLVPPSKETGQFYLEFRDANGNVTISPTYEFSTYSYLRALVCISDNALITNSRNVTLSLQSFDPEFQVSQMSFSNDNQSWSAWENYANTKNWELSSGEGLKTVYLRLKNSQGFIMNMPSSDSIYYITTSRPQTVTSIEMKGKQLYVERPLGEGKKTKLIPYKIKGVCWSPSSIGTSGPSDVAARKAEFVKWYRQDIALMKEMGINTVRTFMDFGDLQVARQILDELYSNDIMVILAVDNSCGDMTNLERVVPGLKDHPAILAWQVGNEWTANNYYGSQPSREESTAFTENAALRIKQLDPFHPVTSSIADNYFVITDQNIISSLEYVSAKKCPSVDFWGLNIYRGASFGALFADWSQISSKPMFLSEAGTDSFDVRLNSENQSLQADFDANLWDEIYFHLSADRPGEPCLGVTFFEWSDEWWKNTYANDIWHQNPGGYSMPFRHPDGLSDEEYYGLIDINRSKKQAYFTLGDRFKKQGQLINFTSSLNLKIISSFDNFTRVEFYKNGSRFHFFGAGSDYGITVAVIDPETGLVEDVNNFFEYSYARDYVNSISNGKIILISLLKPGQRLYKEEFSSAMESLGSRLIRNVGQFDAWAMIAVKGQAGNLAEAHTPYVQGQVLQPVQIEANVSLRLDLDKDGILDSLDADRDNDGLVDTEELRIGTDPLDSDTDDDGLIDSKDPNPIDPTSPEWSLVLPIPFYQASRTYYTAAASCKMILDFIRQSASLTQELIHNFAPLASNRELNADEMEQVLNNFKPEGYHFSVISQATINEALRDIAHWMDYEVPNTVVKNVPVAIPVFGNYNNWMVVKGVASSARPNANQDPWHTGNFTVYGFWLNDPKVSGIGENSYKTAQELANTYYLPLISSDSWNGKFIAVAEPPKVQSKAKVSIARPSINKTSSQLSTLLRSYDQGNILKQNYFTYMLKYDKLNWTYASLNRLLNRFDWKTVADKYLANDVDFNAAIKNSIAAAPLKVKSLDPRFKDYYLVVLDKKLKGRSLTSAVLIMDANNYTLREASWVKAPVFYPRIDENQAVLLACRKASPLYWRSKMAPASKAELVWQPGTISTSPYKPFWKVVIGNNIWFVTQESAVIFGGVVKPQNRIVIK